MAGMGRCGDITFAKSKHVTEREMPGGDCPGKEVLGMSKNGVCALVGQSDSCGETLKELFQARDATLTPQQMFEFLLEFLWRVRKALT